MLFQPADIMALEPARTALFFRVFHESEGNREGSEERQTCATLECKEIFLSAASPVTCLARLASFTLAFSLMKNATN